MDQSAKTALVGAACGLGGIFLGALLFGGSGRTDAATNTNDDPPTLAELEKSLVATDRPVEVAKPVAPAPPPTPPSDWRIEERTDAMTDETIKTACATSSNQVYLDSPYGARGARLCIRQHPKFGRDVYLSLDGSGQILCRSYDGCSIPIRFDDGAVQTFTGNEPSDNSSETIFVANDGRFITAAKSAARIRVQLEFYQNGSQTFDFPAKGLKW